MKLIKEKKIYTGDGVIERDVRHGHAQGAGEGLEDGLGLVVVVVAAGRDLEVASRGACERVEEVAEHFGRNVANPLAIC